MKNLNLKQFIRKDLLNYEEYKAVLSAYDISEKNRVPVEKIDKLDANENLFGPSKNLYKQLSTYKGYQFYPDPEYKQLRDAIGKYAGISANYIIVGSGGDELIDLLLRLILEPSDQVINCPPTFGSYTTLTFLNRGFLINIPRKKIFSLNTNSMLRAVNNKTKLIILCNPNNPTGNVISAQDIKQILELGKLVLVDEAYFEFSGKTVLSFIKKCSNLIILRSFSKWAGIAGLRLGYLIAPPFLIKKLLKIKPPYNVNIAAELAGLNALKDIEYQRLTIKKIIEERERIYKEIKKNKKIKACPSYGNFLFIQVSDILFPRLKLIFQKNKIAVRYYDSNLAGKAFRITIGNPAQNNKVLEILKNI